MTRGISEATDMHGVTHYVSGAVRFVRLSKRRRRNNPAKRGYYVTEFDCRWWCSGVLIPANSPAMPGKIVDCMTCLIRPPEKRTPMLFAGTTTGRYSSIMVSTPSERETQIFDVKTRKTRSIATGRRAGRRR